MGNMIATSASLNMHRIFLPLSVFIITCENKSRADNIDNGFDMCRQFRKGREWLIEIKQNVEDYIVYVQRKVRRERERERERETKKKV